VGRCLHPPASVHRAMDFLRKLVWLAFRWPATLNNIAGITEHTRKEAAVKNNDSDKRLICRNTKETEAYVRNKREDSKLTREYVRAVAEKVVQEHRPALDWLADK